MNSDQLVPCEIELVTYKYGEFELRIIGDPNRLLDVPIAYYTSLVFSAKESIHDRVNKPAGG